MVVIGDGVVKGWGVVVDGRGGVAMGAVVLWRVAVLLLLLLL